MSNDVECPNESCTSVSVAECPVAGKIAQDAADKAVSVVFGKFGFDTNDNKDMKKLILLFDFLETLSNSTKKGKLIIGSTVLTIIVIATVGAVAAKYFTPVGKG